MSVHHRTSMHRDAEAAFTIYESNNPVGIEHSAWNGSFLLIFRTGRIFTIHADTLNNRCNKDEYRQILGCPSIQWGFSTAKIAPTLRSGIPSGALALLLLTSDKPNSSACIRSGPGHFCPAPHVAMGVGLYLHPSPGASVILKQSRRGRPTYSL